MRKLAVFNQVSLDGFVCDLKGDMSWAHKGSDDTEWNAFVAGNASGGGVLLFGRVTYDMMNAFWPTPAAYAQAPAVAEGMNNLQKVVFSRTMKQATWKNTKLVKDDIAGAVRAMKKESGPDLVILGSASIVSQLAQAGLIDQYQVIVNPVALGSGKTMFAGAKERLPLTLTGTRAFKNGNVLLSYDARS